MTSRNQNRVLITGASYLGLQIASALLADGAEVSLILHEDDRKRLGSLAAHIEVQVADMWNDASLRGRARNHGTVIHTVGSMLDEPKQGKTFERLNVIPSRNAANMCVSDGVSHFMFMSAVRAPWLNAKYIHSKREVETYLRKIGLKSSIIRAPIVYERDTSRPILFRMMTLLGSVPLISWSHIGRMAPTPLDMIARGIARIALNPPQQTRIFYAGDLRRLNTHDERHGRITMSNLPVPEIQQEPILPFDILDRQ
jgi:uncharacterized protein YbjT (DUF2867 family)